ncbi:RNA polymerase sigma factor [Mariniblastus fucicola]|uniref:RNA polymerase sigma factor n=1 Tax=Mariniblastus fucicola TaxID=980251 RepID=A0A5B9P901_9BACT|nr:sigma-70 family RNA polymerase sigma factor [Mariniblastus fucicola]QEG21705.1 RNA polymerase sigma factor [Mariniblastus fucicola]
MKVHSMLSDAEFTSLMDKARSGDSEAAQKLVQLYEPEIRRAARMRLTDSKLRRIVDSIDICQSVFGKFFETAQSPKGIDLKKPEQLLGLLVTMTRNRVVDEHRHQTAQKRNAGDGVVEAAANLLVSDDPGPKTEIEMKDMLAKVRSRFTAEELEIADLRGEGLTWDEVAKRLQVSADSCRKRLERGIERVREEMR